MTTLVLSILNGSSSLLNLGKILSLTSELAPLERHRLIMGEML